MMYESSDWSCEEVITGGGEINTVARREAEVEGEVVPCRTAEVFAVACSFAAANWTIDVPLHARHVVLASGVLLC